MSSGSELSLGEQASPGPFLLAFLLRHNRLINVTTIGTLSCPCSDCAFLEPLEVLENLINNHMFAQYLSKRDFFGDFGGPLAGREA